jgi:hypothetical protein
VDREGTRKPALHAVCAAALAADMTHPNPPLPLRRYHDLFHMYKQAIASFWPVEEVDLAADKPDWNRLTSEYVPSLWPVACMSLVWGHRARVVCCTLLHALDQNAKEPGVIYAALLSSVQSKSSTSLNMCSPSSPLRTALSWRTLLPASCQVRFTGAIATSACHARMRSRHCTATFLCSRALNCLGLLRL